MRPIPKMFEFDLRFFRPVSPCFFFQHNVQQFGISIQPLTLETWSLLMARGRPRLELLWSCMAWDSNQVGMPGRWELRLGDSNRANGKFGAARQI